MIPRASRRPAQQLSHLLGEIPGRGHPAPESQPDIVRIGPTGDPEYESVPVDPDRPDLVGIGG